MIYLAKVKVEIKRALRKVTAAANAKKKIKELYKYEKVFAEFEMTYKDGVENDENSFFIGTIKRKIKLRPDKKEEFKITSIEKIKPLGLVSNE